MDPNDIGIALSNETAQALAYTFSGAVAIGAVVIYLLRRYKLSRIKYKDFEAEFEPKIDEPAKLPE